MLVINVNLLVIFTIAGGLIVLFGHKLLARYAWLRYTLGIGLLVLGLLQLFNLHLAVTG